MINRYFREGEKLDVAGLNQIIVLLDRSETEKTEIALNIWPPNLDGPPHKHDEKEQVFYITSGEGKIKIGNNTYQAAAGDLAHIPVGVVHQTIVTSQEPLNYMLFNIFNTADKEGHASFADHIEKVKQIRKKQAESGQAAVAGAEQTESADKPGKFIKNSDKDIAIDPELKQERILLDHGETANCECLLIKQKAGAEDTMNTDTKNEQALFVLGGTAQITIGDETDNIQTGNLVFIPRNTAYKIDTLDENLTCLCLKSLVI